MSIINLDPKEVTALWEASLEDWPRCYERLMDRLIDAFRSDPQARPVCICEEEMICCLQCPEESPKFLELRFFDEQLTEKKRGYDELYSRFFSEHYYGSDW